MQHIAHVEKTTNKYTTVTGKAEGNSPLGRSTCRLENNIKRSLKHGIRTGPES
jgi:hypothetical protein